MKLLLVSLVAIIALIGWQTPAFAYQEEGPYFDLGLGMMSGKVGANDSAAGTNPQGILYQVNQSKQRAEFLFELGGGYSFNLSNSINWQLGLEYFQVGPYNGKGEARLFNSVPYTYTYKIRSSGYWLTNTFHFDLFTGNLTPIQPYIKMLLGYSRNNFYDYRAKGVNGLPIIYNSGTVNNFAYGSDLGLSYQVSKRQIFNFALQYWSLGNSHSNGNSRTSQNLPTGDLNLYGVQFGYLLQF
jgi:hypothetical protein